MAVLQQREKQKELRHKVEKSNQRPRSREGSFHSARSDAREERMMVLEQAVFTMNDVLLEIQQALRPGLRSTGLSGPTPQDGPQEVDRPSDRPPP